MAECTLMRSAVDAQMQIILSCEFTAVMNTQQGVFGEALTRNNEALVFLVLINVFER